MNEAHVRKIATELNIQSRQVVSTAKLFAEGATVPFIARYRKEATGSLDEVAITSIRERLLGLAELDQRRESILKSLVERNLLTDQLKAAVSAADSVTQLEDIYQPYRPKRRTRATIAVEQGLESLADILFAQQSTTDIQAEAKPFIRPSTLRTTKTPTFRNGISPSNRILAKTSACVFRTTAITAAISA